MFYYLCCRFVQICLLIANCRSHDKPEELPDPALCAGFGKSRDEVGLPSQQHQVAAEQLELVVPPHVGGEGGEGLAAVWEGAAGRSLWQFHQRSEGGEEGGEQIGKRLVGEDMSSCKGNRGRARDGELH